MAHHNYVIPLNSDKILFAEDMIYWFVGDRWSSFLQLCGRDLISSVDKYREFIYVGLNETIKKAVQFIDVCIDPVVLEDFISMKNADRLSEESFVQYANYYYEVYFSAGFEATSFLFYCTRLANLAGYFYIERICDIIQTAVDCIVKAFPEGDMIGSGTWDTLNKSAEIFVGIQKNSSEVLTPSDSSSESDTSTEFADSEVSFSDISEDDEDEHETDSSSSKSDVEN